MTLSVAGSRPMCSTTCDLMKHSGNLIASFLTANWCVHQSTKRLTSTVYLACVVSWIWLLTAWFVAVHIINMACVIGLCRLTSIRASILMTKSFKLFRNGLTECQVHVCVSYFQSFVPTEM